MPKNVAIVNERGSIVNDESPARRLVHAPLPPLAPSRQCRHLRDEGRQECRL